eukprot:snap_masked-scaffold_5-processed-gene-17.36-mRNA-1 protein AED:0.36 eAED:0.36 QI:0/0/0/0.5/1/1/2/0/260
MIRNVRNTNGLRLILHHYCIHTAKASFRYNKENLRTSAVTLSRKNMCSMRGKRWLSIGRALGSCWSCGTAVSSRGDKISGNDFFCSNCGKILDSALFLSVDVNESFPIDQKQLERNFKATQRYLHPDKFSTTSDVEKGYSTDLSSLVNKAYKILLNPISRAEYLLEKHGIKAFGEEGETMKNPEILMKSLEVREELSYLSTENEINSFIDAQRKHWNEDFSLLVNFFNIQEYQQAKDKLVELKFTDKVIQEAKEKQRSLF